jgi:hypothetical protein
MKLKLIQNGGKDNVGGPCKKTVVMITTEQNQLVLFAKKQETGVKVCDDCGFMIGVNAALGGAGRGTQGGAGRGARITVPQGGAGRVTQETVPGVVARGSIQT